MQRAQRQGRVPTSFSGNSVLTSAAISTPAEPPPTTTTDWERWTWRGRKQETHPQTQPAQGLGQAGGSPTKLGVQTCFLAAGSCGCLPASPRMVRAWPHEVGSTPTHHPEDHDPGLSELTAGTLTSTPTSVHDGPREAPQASKKRGREGRTQPQSHSRTRLGILLWGSVPCLSARPDPAHPQGKPPEVTNPHQLCKIQSLVQRGPQGRHGRGRHGRDTPATT